MKSLPHSFLGRGECSSQRGFTLIELMVAMTLGLAIVGAVTYVYLQGKQGFTVQDSRSRLQENARLAYSIISRDIMSGGYFGCVKPIVDNNSGIAVSTLRITAAQPLMTADIDWLEVDGDQTQGERFFNPALSIRGYDNGSGWPATTGLAAKRLAGTDTIIPDHGRTPKSRRGKPFALPRTKFHVWRDFSSP